MPLQGSQVLVLPLADVTLKIAGNLFKEGMDEQV